MGEKNIDHDELAKARWPQTGIDLYLRKIRIWVVEHNHTPHSLAEFAGLSPGTLRGLWKASWNPTIHTLRQIEASIIKQEREAQDRYRERLQQTKPESGVGQ